MAVCWLVADRTNETNLENPRTRARRRRRRAAEAAEQAKHAGASVQTARRALQQRSQSARARTSCRLAAAPDVAPQLAAFGCRHLVDRRTQRFRECRRAAQPWGRSGAVGLRGSVAPSFNLEPLKAAARDASRRRGAKAGKRDVVFHLPELYYPARHGNSAETRVHGANSQAPGSRGQRERGGVARAVRARATHRRAGRARQHPSPACQG
jgi:hypothetical protein